ncbi:25053_t:CDS:2, partial [Cetraspora pellucida]
MIRNSTPSKDKDLLPDPISAPRNELAVLYLNAELQSENKNTEETSPIMEVDNEETPMPFCPSKSLLEQTEAQVLNSKESKALSTQKAQIVTDSKVSEALNKENINLEKNDDDALFTPADNTYTE